MLLWHSWFYVSIYEEWAFFLYVPNHLNSYSYIYFHDYKNILIVKIVKQKKSSFKKGKKELITLYFSFYYYVPSPEINIIYNIFPVSLLWVDMCECKHIYRVTFEVLFVRQKLMRLLSMHRNPMHYNSWKIFRSMAESYFSFILSS